MRIAVWHNLPSGGGRRALVDQVRTLTERGHTIEIWCPDTADLSFLPLDQFAVEHVLPMPAGVSGRRLFGGFTWPYNEIVDRLHGLDAHCRAAAGEINRGTFDILLAHPCQHTRAAPIGRYVRIPRVLYLQEPYRYLYEALPRLPWIAPDQWKSGWWRNKKTRTLVIRDSLRTAGLRVQAREELTNVRAFHRVLANSFFSRESILRAYGVDSRVCYLGVDTSRFTAAPESRTMEIVGIGAFVIEKRVALAIEAVAAMNHPRPRLTWIGNVAVQAHLEQLKQLAAARGIDFNPRLRVDDEEIDHTLRTASMFFYAPQLEPFGLAPLEANACGLPVVAVAEGGVRETIVDGVNGFVVDSDPHSLARALERLRDDPELARRLGANGKRLVAERWSLDAAADRLERHLREIADATESSEPPNEPSRQVTRSS